MCKAEKHEATSWSRDRELGIAPILASSSCHQVFNTAVMYNLRHKTFLIFWSILLARFPEVGLLSQNVGAP